MIDFLKKMVSIESIAKKDCKRYPYGAGPAKALDEILEKCKSFGFRVKNNNYKYAYAEIGSGEKLIAIVGHLDVVPAGEGWEYPPYGAEEHDGKIYGRGTIDDKGPMVAAVYAMKDILDSGHIIDKRIRLVIGQTEENGDWVDIEAYKDNEQLPDYGFTPDGEFPAIFIEKGILLLSINMNLEDSGLEDIKGGISPNMVPAICRARVDGEDFFSEGKAFHGSAPWRGVNAISKLMEKISSKSAFATMYMDMFGYDYYGERAGCNFEDNVSGKLSLNPGVVNVENGKVKLLLDIRYPVTYSKNDIIDGITDRAAYFGAEIKEIHHMDKVYMQRDSASIHALLAAYRSVTGDESEPLIVGGGTYARSMKNIIAFGPLMPGQLNTEHCCNEYISREHLEILRKIYFRALNNLLEI